MEQERIYQIALSFIPGIGDILTKQLVSYCGSIAEVFNAPRHRLLKIPGIGEKTANFIREKDYLSKAEKELSKIDKAGIKVTFYTDADYPCRLKQIYDAPILLYHKGNFDFNTEKIVAIVGTRQASRYGKDIVEEIISALKPHKPMIVSGLAYGIDITAHKSALKHGLSTLGVLANGLDIVYPGLHRETADEMLAMGGLISENKLGTQPDAHRFPARNRIIAGMSDLIVVAEAAKKGGALITAELANSYDREVFAVPGKIKDTFSAGCNYLIRNHKAHIFTDTADIEYIMNWDIETTPKKTRPIPADLDEDELKIVDLLSQDNGEMVIDEISWKSQISVNKMASLLLNLEFKGIVKALPGKKYTLN